MNYKKIFSKKNMRFKLLTFFFFIPSKWIIKIQYYLKLGRVPDLKNPLRYTEKLQWYKLYYRNNKMSICSDKYAVREYVKEKNLEHILNDLYFVTDNVNDLILNNLPNKFVIKTTNGSGSNFFCNNISDNEFNDIKKSLTWWLKVNMYLLGREWSYKNIKPKIIVEKLLENDNDNFVGINDYKFICFDGIPKFVVLDVDRSVGHKRNIYDMKWNLINVSTDYPNIVNKVSRPKNFDEMIDVAKKLSEGFPHVRVDLYNISGKIYFGEMTFYPWTGYVQFNPDSFDYLIGRSFNLTKIRGQKE